MIISEKCEAILKRMLEIANSEEKFSLERDFGDFTATVIVGNAHTHVGIPGEDGNWENFIESLYNTLHGGPGLSWTNQLPLR